LGGKRLHTVNARVLDAFYDDLQRYGSAKAASRAKGRAKAEAIARARTQARLSPRRSPARATNG